jgi:hypothetical protein
LNPYRIYRDEAADALRRQATASSYRSFVAMPFREGFRYRSRRVFKTIISAAVDEANGRHQLPRSFAAPQRVDQPQGAVVITEEIVLGILESHIFIADLTLQNTGVVLETGIALGTKPNMQVVLITQHDPGKLHFDLRANNVIRYTPNGSVSPLADALCSAARHFEEQIKRFIVDVRKRLSPEALAALRWFAEIQQQNVHYSLHSKSRGPNFTDQDGPRRFDAAVTELRTRDLLWTDYAVGASPTGGDAFGMHATDFGWTLIESLWPTLRRPPGAKVTAT